MATDTPNGALAGIKRLMLDGRWWTLWELRSALWDRWHIAASETAIPARLRELLHERRPWAGRSTGSRACEYRVVR